ncbi:hypothetical protein VFPPC_16279 [Pochonia chlamydosporia 170]|uniref:Uncharacterized protein n=1 Tax=Pochonia chlamydosporia 170 TaxID=1380566 RepID=A0A179FHA2_METCM|nr:hypothetical protein VFPPC_16279 [Pochonia chlamydosporia 170]OAQ64916.1 hypothetical protein VFPPC_16279 [Pochonia chlamydosporia 170]
MAALFALGMSCLVFCRWGGFGGHNQRHCAWTNDGECRWILIPLGRLANFLHYQKNHSYAGATMVVIIGYAIRGRAGGRLATWPRDEDGIIVLDESLLR